MFEWPMRDLIEECPFNILLECFILVYKIPNLKSSMITWTITGEIGEHQKNTLPLKRYELKNAIATKIKKFRDFSHQTNVL